MTATAEDWSAVDLKPLKALRKTITLADVKAHKELAGMALIRLGRLSVQPVTPAEWDMIMEMAGEK